MEIPAHAACGARVGSACSSRDRALSGRDTRLVGAYEQSRNDRTWLVSIAGAAALSTERGALLPLRDGYHGGRAGSGRVLSLGVEGSTEKTALRAQRSSNRPQKYRTGCSGAREAWCT